MKHKNAQNNLIIIAVKGFHDKLFYTMNNDLMTQEKGSESSRRILSLNLTLTLTLLQEICIGR